jgi:hypothetical protein
MTEGNWEATMNGSGSGTDEFSFAKESITQIIALSSAILALSLTFSKDWVGQTTPDQKLLLEAAWIAFLVAILAGLWSLSAITGLVHSKRYSTTHGALRVPWIVEILAFLIGLGLFIWFGFRVL